MTSIFISLNKLNLSLQCKGGDIFDVNGKIEDTLMAKQCFKQGVEPFKITFQFRFSKKIFLGSVPVQLRFGFGIYFFVYF